VVILGDSLVREREVVTLSAQASVRRIIGFEIQPKIQNFIALMSRA
jgi:hypothetical protein